MKASSAYRAYLLRMWREGETKGWRATIQNPTTGERRSFANLSALLAFLEEQTGEKWVMDSDCDDQGGGICN